MLKISLDIDGTICEWMEPYIKRFGIPKKESDISKNVVKVLQFDKNFWLTLPIINVPDFEVFQYTTARIIPKIWTKQYLELYNMPKAPIYQVRGYSLSKVPKLRMRNCDVHIDDSLSVFIDCNLKGIPCLLIDREHNRDWGPIGRIFSLKQDHIIETYHLFMKTMFPHFKDLVNAA